MTHSTATGSATRSTAAPANCWWRQVRAKVNWTSASNDKSSPTAMAGPRFSINTRPTSRARTTTTRASARRRSAPRTNSRRPIRRTPSCSMCRPPRLHGYEPFQGELHARPALCRGDAVDVIRLPARPTWVTPAPDARPQRLTGAGLRVCSDRQTRSCRRRSWPVLPPRSDELPMWVSPGGGYIDSVAPNRAGPRCSSPFLVNARSPCRRGWSAHRQLVSGE